MKVAANRARKQHVQQELFRRCGKRKGAGRKPNGPRAGSRHQQRPEIKSRYPLHVVMRVVPAVGSMRRRAMYKAMREATITAALRERFPIVHISLQRTHVHMLVEAETKEALARGMQGFQVSAARNINTALRGKYGRRRGKVFADRYHVAVIESPTRARRALLYVIDNWRKAQGGSARTGEHLAGRPAFDGNLVPGLQELEGKDFMWPIRESYDPLIVRTPESWLLREGWKLCRPISARDVPSKRP